MSDVAAGVDVVIGEGVPEEGTVGLRVATETIT